MKSLNLKITSTQKSINQTQEHFLSYPFQFTVAVIPTFNSGTSTENMLEVQVKPHMSVPRYKGVENSSTHS
jgi:hypothetical protein